MFDREQNLSERTYFNLLRTLGVVRRVVDPLFAEFGISGGQWGVLRVLLADENAVDSSAQTVGLRLSDIGDRLLIRPPSVTTVVERLVESGLVECDADAHDHRAKRLRLSPRGRKLARKITLQHEEKIHEMMAGLNQVELLELNTLLEQLGGHLQSNAFAAATSRTVSNGAK